MELEKHLNLICNPNDDATVTTPTETDELPILGITIISYTNYYIAKDIILW